jgi:hypothetical protein
MDPMTLMAAISTGSSLLQGLSGIAGGTKAGGMEKDARDALRRQSEYSQASVDQSHPWNRALTASIKEQLQREAASSIMDEMRMRRRAIAAGNFPAGTATSRQDESRSAALAKSFINAAIKGQLGANEMLNRAAGQQGSVAGGYMDLNTVQNARQGAQKQNMFGFGANAPFAIGNLIKMFSGSNNEPDAGKFELGQMLPSVSSGFAGSP